MASLGDPNAGGASPLPRVKYPGTELCVWRPGFRLERCVQGFPLDPFRLRLLLQSRSYRNFSHASPRVEKSAVASHCMVGRKLTGPPHPWNQLAFVMALEQ